MSVVADHGIGAALEHHLKKISDFSLPQNWRGSLGGKCLTHRSRLVDIGVRGNQSVKVGGSRPSCEELLSIVAGSGRA